MKARILLRLAILWMVLVWPTVIQAQEISLAGTVVDATEAVLPGVTVTALHVETGNTFLGVTNALGEYRIGAMRPGVYTIKAELAGFAPITQQGLELLVGQSQTLKFKLVVSSVAEAVTVTGQSALVNLTESSLGGNIDTRQMEELPVNGRNWLQLTMLAPGSRANAVDNAPVGDTGWFQLNLDGQQVSATQTGAGTGQPKFSRDAIGEFELISGRFEATQGRSQGMQVNAVTKAGTNTYTGTVSGYFRDDSLNARDFVVNRVLPYSNQQISTTFGGPLKLDRAHFFGYYEGERSPSTITFTSNYPRFNLPDIANTQTQHTFGGRVDVQLTGKTRAMVRGNGWLSNLPINNPPGSLNHPSTLISLKNKSGQIFGTLTRAGGQSVNEFKAGLSLLHYDSQSYAPTSPQITLRGYTIGKSFIQPIVLHQNTYSVRDDFMFFLGRHELKLGGEMLVPVNYTSYSNSNDGAIVATGGPAPANIEELFPVWNDPSTWNLAALSPITIRYQRGFGESGFHRTKPQTAAWLQDNWKPTGRLTLNLGVRWDFDLDWAVNELALPPFREPAPQEWWNIAPRLGFAYSLADTKTVIRGGWGLYFIGIRDQMAHGTYISAVNSVSPSILNDGRADFAANPYNGPLPTFEQAKRMGPLDLSGSGWVVADTVKTPYSHQTSVGFQRQLRETMSIQADYVWYGNRRQENSRNVNISFDPVTGANYRFTSVGTRPFPDYGLVVMRFTDAQSTYQALETAFTKRFGHHWQASATYTLGRTRDYVPPPLLPGCTAPYNGVTRTCDTPIAVAKDLGDEWAYAVGDQRHRAVFNGIGDLPYKFQLSGLYFFGSGQRTATTYGGDLRVTGGGFVSRLRPDGTIVPRNNFVGKPLHRVDLRVQRRLPLGRRRSIDPMVEVFNVFNHANYGAYVTNEATGVLYGRPVQAVNVAYQPRIVQVGFRMTF